MSIIRDYKYCYYYKDIYSAQISSEPQMRDSWGESAFLTVFINCVSLIQGFKILYYNSPLLQQQQKHFPHYQGLAFSTNDEKPSKSVTNWPIQHIFITHLHIFFCFRFSSNISAYFVKKRNNRNTCG